MARLNDVHAFGYNSAGSERIWMNFGALRVYYINYSNTTKNNILFIDVSVSRQKPSSGLTPGAGRQYVKVVPYVAQLVAPLDSIHVVGLPDMI